jgi:hypothetical protein
MSNPAEDGYDPDTIEPGLDNDKLRAISVAGSLVTLRETSMPFATHYIEPEHMEGMRAAFYKVCDALLLRGDIDDPMTEIIANKIVALAKAGEHDANRLVELVLNDLADDAAA